MPRASVPQVFKKRKSVRKSKITVPVTRPVESEESVRPRPTIPIEDATLIAKPTDSAKGSSSAKLTPNIGKYDSYYESDCTNKIVNSELKQILSDVAVCRECSSDLHLTLGKKCGLATELIIDCESCSRSSKYFTSPTVHTAMEDGKETTSFDVNVRYVYGLRSIGKGPTAGKMLAAIMNLPSPPYHYSKYTDLLGNAVKDVCISSMALALEEAV